MIRLRCCNRSSRAGWLAVSAAAAVSAFAVLGAEARTSAPRAASQAGDLPDLVGPLKASEGCLGVRTAQTSDGKNVIFAWFEDKAAARRWYYSEAHQSMMHSFFPEEAEEEHHEPMAGVPENVGPILAIASITMAKDPDAGDQPFTQIAIELYTPITGGLNVGGRFAPKGLVVPKRKVIVDEG
jgi:hypothetical protein